MPVRFDKISRSMTEQLANELLALVTALSGIISANAPRAVGALAASFSASAGVPAGDGSVSASVGSPLWGSYGIYPEFGTQPHWPPLGPLLIWAREKHGTFAVGVSFTSGKAQPTGRGIRRNLTISNRRKGIDSIYAIAKAVQVAISKRGTRAQLYVAKSIESLGLAATKVETDSEIFYSIDLNSWMEKNRPDFWDRLQST